MQNFIDDLNENDRRIVRKWRWATLGFYGSILAGLVLYVALNWNPELNFASVDATAHAKLAGAARGDARTPFAP